MATLLTRIWKAATGAFFETELEALTAERKADFKKAYVAAWKEAGKQDMENYTKAKALYDEAYAQAGIGRTHMNHPEDPSWKWKTPPDFSDKLFAELQERNLLAPIVLSTPPEG
jgi:hypothetical protein